MLLFLLLATSFSTVPQTLSFQVNGDTALIFQKVKGMSYTTYANMTPNVLSSRESNESSTCMKQIGVEWVAITVVGWYQSNNRSADIHENRTQAPSNESLSAAIQFAHSLGMHVMLKPMIDLEDSRWRGEIQPSDAWFQNYTNYIDSFANLAEQNKVEMFCIGTELNGTVSWEAQWRNVVSSVRQRYSGLLTYAATWWKEYDKLVKWWDALDYVGINAYFPLSNKTDPTITEIKNTWHNINNYLDSFYSKVHKPIIFTEVGYLSTDGTNQDPSNYRLQYDMSRRTDCQEQADCYEAAFEAVWRKSWFVGMFWWYWQTNPDAGGPNNRDYTPQNKLAQDVIRKWYLTPTVSIVSPENKTYATNNVPLDYAVSNPTSWIGYSLDGQVNMTVAGNTTLTGLSNGLHSVIVYANSTAGNIGTSETVYFSIKIQQSEPFPIIWIAAAVAAILTAGVVIAIYKKKKTSSSKRP
jgi:hypothetical protein